MRYGEGEVKDLVEKLERGEITSKEIVEKLKERRLTEKAILKYEAWGYVIWGILCFLPAIAKYSGLEVLSFLVRLPTIKFPAIIIYLAIAFFVAAIPLTVSGVRCNIKKGGCHSEDETIILLREGPYKVLRHPSHLAWTVFFVTIPIFISKWVPFTILSIVGIVQFIALSYHTSLKEEKELDLEKWGDEYRQYMVEVPRWNFIKGLCNLKRRGKP